MTKIIAEIGINQQKPFSEIIVFICMIIKIDENTLGKKQQIVSTTKLTVRCDECNKNEWSCTQSNIKQNKSGRNICQSCKNILGISGMKGKKHSEKTINLYKNGGRAGDNNISKRTDVKKKISDKLKGVNTWSKGKIRPEHAKLMSELMLNIWSTDNEYREKLINSNKKHSKLHDIIKVWLNDNNLLLLESEKQIPGTLFIADEVDFNNKIILNINGDYWHCNPNKYKPNDIIIRQGKTKLVQEIWNYDTMRDKIFKSKGYRIITIWESDFKDNKDKILKDFKKLYE